MANAPSSNPYVGPRAFRRDETMFGRDREARDLFDLLVSERIVLLHSPSGAGKSSLIQAALIPHLTAEEEGFGVLPLIRVNEPPRLSVANRYIYSLLHSLENMTPAERRLPIETLAQLNLAEYLEQRLPAQDEAPSIVFIFDQFEEILSLDPTDGDAKADFFTQVGYALRDQQRWALFAMREDYLGALEPYRRFVPTRLDNTFRLELLGPAAADQAIQKPALNRQVDFQIEAVQQLRDDLRKMRLQQPDGETVERLGPYIEPVQLQVVCSRLWEEYGASGQITLEHVKAIGNVDEALAAYYAASVKAAAIKTGVPERLVRDWFAQHLITRQGLRGQVLREPDESGGLHNDTIEALIEEHLVRREERSGATWYELAHDRLIEPVQHDNTRWFEQQLSPLQKRAGEWSQQNEPPDLLFRGIDLTLAEQWASEHDAELSKIERKFLKECQEARALEEQRIRNAEDRAELERLRAEQAAQVATRLRGRNRIILGLAAVALVAAIVAVAGFIAAAESAQGIGQLAAQVKASADKAEAAAVVARDKQHEAEAAQQRADEEREAAAAAKVAADELRDQAEQRNRSLQLADYVDDVMRPDLAFLLSLEAHRIADTVEARASLLSALQSNAHLVQFLQYASAAPLYSTAFSPDGSLVAAGGSATDGENGLIHIWRSDNGELLTTITTTHPIVALTFIDQEQLAAKDLVGSLTQWNWHTGESSAFQSPASLDQLNTLVVSSDGQRLAASSFNTIYLWDVASRDLIAELATPDASVAQLVFNPDDPTFLAASYSDGTLRLWDVDTGQTTALSRTPDDLPTGALSFVDGQVAAYAPGTLVLWDTDQNITSPIKVGSTAALAVLSPAAGTVVTLNDPTDRAMTLFDLGNESRETLQAHTDQIVGLAASSDGRWFASSTVNGEVVLWRMKGSSVASEPLTVGGNIAGAIFSPDQQQIIVVDPVQITWWDHASTHILAQRSVTELISSAAANPEHDRLAVGASDGTIELWSLSQQQTLGDPITGYVAPLDQLTFSSDGRWLAGLDGSGYLSVTELAAGQPWQPKSDLSLGVTSIAFHPSKPSLLAVARDDGRVELYDVTSGERTSILQNSSFDLVNHLAFSHDGRTLAASAPGVVDFWDVETGAELPALQIEGGAVTSLLFDHAGTTLVTGMSDNLVILWDIATGRRLGTLRGHTGPVNVLALSEDGMTLASGSDDATVILWQIAEENWKQIACHTAGRNLTQEEWQRYLGQETYRLTCPDIAQ